MQERGNYRSATILTANDYSKAFNRVSYQHCLDALRRKGASTPILRIIASFLTNRTMSVRAGDKWSSPLQVNGGCPQGLVLGVLLFNTTTDDLENDFLARESARLRLPAPSGPPTPPPNRHVPLADVTASTPEAGAAGLDLELGVSPISAGGFNWDDKATAERPNLTHIQSSQPVLHDPPLEQAVGTQVLVEKQVRVFKYVDDNITCEKLNNGGTPIATIGGAQFKTKQAMLSQNAFRSISSNRYEGQRQQDWL